MSPDSPARRLATRKWPLLYLPEIQEVVALMFPTMHTRDLAAFLGTDTDGIYSIVRRLGLKKDPEWERQMRREIALRPENRMRESRFKPGHTIRPRTRPGQSGNPHPNSLANLRRGVTPENTRPFGTQRLRQYDNVLEQKIAMTGPRHLQWRSVHRLVWEAVHGPTPPGHMVVFKTGQHTTDPDKITIDRLELLSRSEAALRHLQNNQLPDGIRKLMRTAIVLKREINRHRKAQAHD